MELEVVELVWDEINIKHIWDKHKVRQEEVEQAVSNEDHIANRMLNGRVLLIGLTGKERLISIILSPKDVHKRT